MKKICFCLMCSILLIGLVVGCGNSTVSPEQEDNQNESEVYSVKWGTGTPLVFNDEKYGIVNISVRGTYSYKIIDSNLTTSEDLEYYINSMLISECSRTIPSLGNDYQVVLNSEKVLESNMLKNTKVDGVEIISVDIEVIQLTDASKEHVNQINNQ